MLKAKLLIPILIVVVAAGGWFYLHEHHKHTVAQTAQRTATAKAEAAQVAATELASHCADSTYTQEIVVSISKQHMWACQGTKTVYDNAIITGMEMYPADLTPTGTYQIYAKATDQILAGSDATGKWSDNVSYWMPFLDNQYGVYGFHDATWRAPSDFGNVNINVPYTAAKFASHGCIEMPLAAAAWLYNWAPVGTTVLVQA